MKNFFIILFSLLIFTSCSKNDNESFDINGTFTHNIPNCDNSSNPEENCTEFIWFNDSSTASIMLGGIDYGTPTIYKLRNNQIEFYYNNGEKSELTLKIIDDKTLKRIQDDAIFLKEE